MTQSVTEHILAVGRQIIPLPVDAVLLAVISFGGAAHLCVQGDATESATVDKVIVLVKAGDLLPDPQGTFVGSTQVLGVGYHCFDLTDAV